MSLTAYLVDEVDRVYDSRLVTQADYKLTGILALFTRMERDSLNIKLSADGLSFSANLRKYLEMTNLYH